MATKKKAKPQPIIDFKELSSYPGGNGLEALVRLLGERMGFAPEWTGTGPDEGRDLTFNEFQKGKLSQDTMRWLVSCKDNSESGKNVSESEFSGNIVNKAKQHRCSGFLLATTTSVTSGLKAMLDGLNENNELKTRIWDEHKLRQLLLNPKNRSLFQQFFPHSFTELDSERRRIKEQLAEFKKQVDAKFGLPHYVAHDEGSEYSRVTLSDEQIPGYSVELEFPQFVDNGVPGIHEVNLIIRAEMLKKLHKIRAERMLSFRDFRVEARDHWERVRQDVRESLENMGEPVPEPPSSAESTDANEDLSNWTDALINDFEVTLLTDRLVSVRFSYYHSSASAAHPNHWIEVLNYQLDPPIPLSVVRIGSEEGGFLEAVSEFCIRAIRHQKSAEADWTPELEIEETQIFADDLPGELSVAPDEWTTKGAAPTPENLEKFCLTKEGILFIFDEYQVNCYVAGMYQALIRYSAVKELLNPLAAVSELA